MVGGSGGSGGHLIPANEIALEIFEIPFGWRHGARSSRESTQTWLRFQTLNVSQRPMNF